MSSVDPFLVAVSGDARKVTDPNHWDGLHRPASDLVLGWHTIIEGFRPKEFILELPAITVDGKSYNIQPIRFSVTRGIGLYQD